MEQNFYQGEEQQDPSVLFSFGVRIELTMNSEAFHLFWVLEHLGRVGLNNLSNIIYGH